MIKILHLTYDMRIGGTEQVIKNLIEANDPNKFNMSILCIEAPIGPFGKMLQEQGINIDSIPRQEGFDAGLILKIRKYIRQHKIDILHCHQYTPWVYGVLAAAMTKTKVIFTEHGRFYPDSSSWKRKLVNPILDMLTDHITAISEATKQALVTFENLPAARIQVIYNGIKPLVSDKNKVKALRQQLQIPEKATVLGTIARLDPIKNHKMMINAFSQVLETQPDTYLIIVGDGEERENIEKQVNELNLGERVILTGYEPEPVNLLALMDIFLLSSLSEGTSMTLLEAMSLGKPCVVTDAGGNPEIIEDGYNGYVTKNDNSPAYSSATIKILSSPELATTFQNNTRIRFSEKFSVNSMYESFTNHYNK